jgi:hypothetical protein
MKQLSRNMKIKLTLFILFLLQAVSFKAQTNLVVNGSFEEVDEDSNSVGWTYGTQPTTNYSVVDAEDAPAGTKVINIQANAGGTATNLIQTVESIVAGEKYKISFYYKIHTPESSSGGLEINYR